MSDALQAQIQDHTALLIERLKLLRDYATTPGNAWLAQGELAQIQTHMAELEAMIDRLKTDPPLA